VLLQSQLARGLTATAGGFLAREVTHPKLAGVDHQAAPVDKHFRLARRGLDDYGSLENCGYPDTPAVDFGFEVRKDLVVLVHLDSVEAHELNGALQRVGSRLSV
jgi:hypothetical protein